jgi:hypothetical protein
MADRAHTVRQVAEHLGIRPHGVLTLIRSGQLVAHDVSLQPGGRPRWRIMPADLEDFLARRTYAPPAPRRRPRKNQAAKVYF